MQALQNRLLLSSAHSTQFSGNALTPSPSPCTWAGIPPSWVISNTDHLT
jgi:hypothetical protein